MKFKTLVVSVFAALSTATAAQAQTVLKVGSTPTGSPFTFLDTKTNSIEGVMVDIVKAVGKEAGFEVQIEPMAFSALIGSLIYSVIMVVVALSEPMPNRSRLSCAAVLAFNVSLPETASTPR